MFKENAMQYARLFHFAAIAALAHRIAASMRSSEHHSPQQGLLVKLD